MVDRETTTSTWTRASSLVASLEAHETYGAFPGNDRERMCGLVHVFFGQYIRGDKGVLIEKAGPAQLKATARRLHINSRGLLDGLEPILDDRERTVLRGPLREFRNACRLHKKDRSPLGETSTKLRTLIPTVHASLEALGSSRVEGEYRGLLGHYRGVPALQSLLPETYPSNELYD